MYADHSVAVVVPAYDEAAFVGGVIDTVPEFVDRVYAVDDASTDDTWERIRARAHVLAPDPAELSGPPDPTPSDADGDTVVVGVRHARNRGVGATVTTGYRYALADGMDVTAVMNGDGQMDPDQLHRLLDPVVAGSADYAKGNRLRNPAHRAPMSAWRLFGNAVLTLLTKIAAGYWRIGDPQNGYTAASRAALEALDLDAVHDRFGFLNDVLVRLNAAGCRVADVSMPAVYGDEESHIAYRTFVPTLSALLLHRFLWRLYADATRRSHLPDPAATCYAGGTGLVTSGGVIGLATALRVGTSPESMDLAAGLLAVGALFVAAGALYERGRRGELETVHESPET